MQPLKIFVGWDSREPVAYHVLAHSILTRASIPVAIIPLVQSQFRAAGLYTRERGPTESTEFSLTRFLVPYLSGFEGFSVFMDCDMLCRADIAELVRLVAEWRPAPALWVCQHDYVPTTATKMDGQAQTSYPRKNWSSLMVFHNARCRALSLDYVNVATGLALHRFQWLRDDEIAPLPLEWNWLVGEYAPNLQAKVLHYTLGGPWFLDYLGCDHADLWQQEYSAMTNPPLWRRENWLSHAEAKI